MNSLMNRAVGILNSGLGRCPRCMRQSFLFALGAWAVTIVLAVAQVGPTLVSMGVVAATSLTLLWFGHITAVALRSAKHEYGIARNGSGGTASHDSPVGPRRRFMLAFVKSAVFVAAVTALPVRAVLAGTCPCKDPTPKCCWSYDAKFYVCAPDDAVCCSHPTNPWFCGKDQNCNGDGSTLPKCR